MRNTDVLVAIRIEKHIIKSMLLMALTAFLEQRCFELRAVLTGEALLIVTITPFSCIAGSAIFLVALSAY